MGEYKFTCGCSEVCFSFNNKKVGSSNRKFCNGAIMNRFYRKGVLNGISRTVDSSGKLSSFGRWTKGCKVGTWWERVEGDGWVISNSKTEQKIFLYPDHSTALMGKIHMPSCVSRSSLTICDVVSLNSEFGILVPVLRDTGLVLPVGEGISDTVKGCPDVSDPYEDTTVEVMESLIPGAGKGLFAKEDVEAGKVIAYFAGVVEEGLENDKSEYSITWIDGARLNIPEELLGSYKSSKVISTFQFNVMILYKKILGPHGMSQFFPKLRVLLGKPPKIRQNSSCENSKSC